MKAVISTFCILFVSFIMPSTVFSGDLAERFYSISRFLQGQVAATKSSPQKSSHEWPYQNLINQAALRWQMDPLLIASVIRHESNFNPGAVSHKGASGLMQLMPQTALEMGVTSVFDPAQNINGGTRYLRLMHDRYAGDLHKMLYAYNAGPTRVDSGRIPRESRIYASRVIDTYKRLRGY